MTKSRKTDSDALTDDWASAMAEQVGNEAVSADLSATAAEAPPVVQSASGTIFKSFDKSAEHSATARELDMIMDIPVKLNVDLGRTRITIKQLLELTQGSVVELDGLAGDPMDILINGYLVAQGEVVVVDNKYGIRIIEITTPSERIQKLNR